MIAALFIDSTGNYQGIEGLDLWAIGRDARLYKGPYPVIAHPPCSRWSRFAKLNESRWGFIAGADDGCFESALQSARTFGGVLEHPAYSDAWPAFNLTVPDKKGGWKATNDGGYCCQVEQGNYGCRARKPTWLICYKVPFEKLPNLKWGKTVGDTIQCGSFAGPGFMNKRERSSTTPEFRDILISIAKNVTT